MEDNVIKKCIECNKELNKQKFFCSLKCKGINKHKSSSEERNCLNCKKIFNINFHLQNKYCSKKCSGIGRTNNANCIIKCLYCHNDFKIKKINKTKYCSKLCFSKHIKILNLNKTSKKVRYKKECIECNKEFYVHNYRKETANFCSQSCNLNSKRIIIKCFECEQKFKIAKWEKNTPMNILCTKCRKNSKKLRPLRKSSFELNVIFLLKEKINNIIIDNRIKINNKIIFPDIIIGKNIIECQGNYWHCNPKLFNKEYYHKQKHLNAGQIWDYDNNKKNELIKLGYNVLYIWEEDFYKNKEKSINELINKLK